MATGCGQIEQGGQGSERGDRNQDRSCWLEPLQSGPRGPPRGRGGRSSAVEEFVVRRQKNQLCRVYGALGVEAGAHLVSSPPAGRVIICPLFASQPSSSLAPFPPFAHYLVTQFNPNCLTASSATNKIVTSNPAGKPTCLA